MPSPSLYESFITLPSLATLVRTLTTRQLLSLWAAMFSMFSILGFAMDLLHQGRDPIVLLAMNVLSSGGFAVLYLRFSLPIQKARLAATIVGHLVFVVVVNRAFSLLPDAPPGRLTVDASGIIAATIVGYSLFLHFINSTAARYLRVQAEIAVARDIHRVLVPAVDCRIGRFEFFGRSDASGDVGGDLVDVVDDGGRWLAYVADVSGHGVGPGLVMGLCKSAMRMRARAAGGIGPLLDDVHAVLMPLKPSATFVTVACVRGGVDDRLECAVAGHLPVLRVRKGTVEEVTEPQLALGMFDGTTFRAKTIDTQPGDLFALLTDGIIEVFDGETRELGLDWAKQVLAAEHDRPLAAIADRLFGSARAHGPQLDDQTLLLIRRA
jgi:sigma-B regulation protein RsbU (phosphoserine phosphatase)